VTVFQDWPETRQSKVPSEVSYSFANGSGDRERKQWGFSIGEGSRILRWTKLELVKGRSPREELGTLKEIIDGMPEMQKLHSTKSIKLDVPKHLTKTSEDVIEYYLSLVAREWQASMTDQARHVLDRITVDLVVTHPAVRNKCLKFHIIRYLIINSNGRIGHETLYFEPFARHSTLSFYPSVATSTF